MDKRNSLILWTSVAAAAAGIAVVAGIMKWREREAADGKLASHLRDVQDVLTDCYEKVREIEQRLPTMISERPLRERPLANGNPV